MFSLKSIIENTKSALFVAAIISFNCLVFLNILELILSKWHLHQFRSQPHPYATSGVFNDSQYAEKLYEEFWQGQTEYVPYVHWRYSDKKGTYINVESGHRRTENNSLQPSAKKVFLFGGSTMWGTGARDSATIASFVAKELNGAGAYYITNFGQSGYFSTQETIGLTLELAKGNVPDIVIFYDGVNDLYIGGYSPGNSYQFLAYDQWKNKQEDVSFKSALRKHLIRTWERSHIFEAFLRIGLIRPRETDFDSLISDPDVAPRAFRAIDAYLKNIALVAKLAESHRFKAYFFWQPFLVTGTKRFLSPREKESIRTSSRRIIQIAKEGYSLIRQSSPSNVHDISGIFDEIEKPMYLDFCHVSDLGNSMIGQRIARVVLSSERPQSNTGQP